MGLIAELMSPFIYPFILGGCGSVWKSSRNQCGDFGNYHSIYCASCEQDWFIWPAGSLKEWWFNFLSPDASSGSMQRERDLYYPSTLHSFFSRLKLHFASGYQRAGSRYCTRTVFTNSVKFPFLLDFSEKWWPRSSDEDILYPVNIPCSFGYVF